VGPPIWERRQCSGYHIQNTVDVVHNIGIRKSECPIASAGKQSVATLIRLAVMRIAINLDHERLSGTEKIYDEPADHRLTSDLVAEPGVGQASPEPLLGLGGIVAHQARSVA